MKHTPGPWNYQEFIFVKGKFAISDATGVQFGSVQEEANARLIASAPKLLEALKILNNDDFSYETEYDGRMYGICMFCNEQDGKHSKECVKDKIKLLIAKIEGNHE